jgi:hypothetical protein
MSPGSLRVGSRDVASNLACVGLAVDDEAALETLLRDVEPDSRSLGQVGGVKVRRWEDPSGARLVYSMRRGEITEFLPSFAARPGARLGEIRFVSDEVAAATIVDEDGEQVTGMTIELEQHRLLRARGATRSGRAAIIALGVDVAVFDDAAAFSESPASLLGDRGLQPPDPPAEYAEHGLEWPPRVAAESFMSYGMFAQGEEATAHARLSGTVIEAEARTVARTGQRFVAARVASFGFEATVCFPADDTAEPAQPGNVIHGTVFLVGDMDLPFSVARRRSWWGQLTRR